MQVQLGRKIRELRRKYGRTQEDLAVALGVTAQAVSRWESGGGYPDMELLPAIANYFHVTIDELFGYQGDREDRIRGILAAADAALNMQADLTECVSMLREAAAEFPSDGRILLRLGYALNRYGLQKYGARGFTRDGSDYTHEDTEYHSQNIFWQEALQIFEQLLHMDLLSSDDRECVILLMVTLYAKMGENGKAKALCEKRDSVCVSRECLLPMATAEKERDACFGRAIIALMRELKQVLANAVATNLSLANTRTGIEKLLALARLYEAIFDDGNCGTEHGSLRDLYLYCGVYQARLGDEDRAMEYFDRSFRHDQKYRVVLQNGALHYTAPLVSKVTESLDSPAPAVSENFWRGWIELLPEHMQERIRQDPQYADCFRS